jgi:hypothetical protein
MSGAGIHTQRDQALACLILAGAVSLSVLLSVFGETDKAAIANARAAVAAHETLETQTAEVLAQNQRALDEAQSYLKKIRQSQAR